MAVKVLVVDDQEDMLRLLELTMADDPRYDLLLATDGESAMEVAIRERPVAIFLDVMMPGIDGFRVCQALKADPRTKMTKIIMLTALAQDIDRQRAEEAGADGYITKPIIRTALLERLDEILGNEDA